jgi:hypothetical protein
MTRKMALKRINKNILIKSRNTSFNLPIDVFEYYMKDYCDEHDKKGGKNEQEN